VPSRSSTAARRRIVENEIVEQAARLFAERGFAGTSVQDIADAMGMSRPALYYYFKSKDDLLASLVTEVTEGAAAQIRAVARDGDKNATERLRSVARLLASWRAQQPGRFLLLVRSESVLPPELAQVNERAKRSTLGELTKLIEQGVAAGEFRMVDPRSAALAVLGICNWVAWWADPSGRTDPADVGAAMADLAIAMVAQTRPPGSPPSPAAALAAVRRELDQLERLLPADHDGAGPAGQ
jgi:AcrR family transcriptional regulator